MDTAYHHNERYMYICCFYLLRASRNAVKLREKLPESADSVPEKPAASETEEDKSED